MIDLLLGFAYTALAAIAGIAALAGAWLVGTAAAIAGACLLAAELVRGVRG